MLLWLTENWISESFRSRIDGWYSFLPKWRHGLKEHSYSSIYYFFAFYIYIYISFRFKFLIPCSYKPMWIWDVFLPSASSLDLGLIDGVNVNWFWVLLLSLRKSPFLYVSESLRRLITAFLNWVKLSYSSNSSISSKMGFRKMRVFLLKFSIPILFGETSPSPSESNS